jgi:hypothetical protein
MKTRRFQFGISHLVALVVASASLLWLAGLFDGAILATLIAASPIVLIALVEMFQTMPNRDKPEEDNQ